MDYTYWAELCREQKDNREQLEEILLEGRGPGGISVIIRVKTANQVETAADFALFFEKRQGHLGEKVRWLFREKGEILVSKYYSNQTEDAIMLAALSVGAEDVEFGEGDVVRILCPARKLADIAELLEFEDVPVRTKRLCYQPKELFPFYQVAEIQAIIALMEDLTKRDDVLDVTADFLLDDVVCKKLGFHVY